METYANRFQYNCAANRKERLIELANEIGRIEARAATLLERNEIDQDDLEIGALVEAREGLLANAYAIRESLILWEQENDF